MFININQFNYHISNLYLSTVVDKVFGFLICAFNLNISVIEIFNPISINRSHIKSDAEFEGVQTKSLHDGSLSNILKYWMWKLKLIIQLRKIKRKRPVN